MSDYIYMLESRLEPDQNRAVEALRASAGEANVNVFLTGGAMRDMLGGFRIRDLDFAVEGNALKVAKAFCDRTNAATVSTDENQRSTELLLASGATVQISMSRREKYARPGAKPQVTPATIQDDLRGRDFTCNAIALSLNQASRGLLLDPMNGLADIGRRELRSVSAYGFYDDPSRLLRLERFRVRLGFTIEDRTQMQVANAREAGVEKLIPARVLGEELKRISAEDSPAEILRALEGAELLAPISPALAGPKLNLPGLAKFEKICRLLPDDARHRAARLGPFFYVLTEQMTPKEEQSLIHGAGLQKAEADLWLKLGALAKKLESALRSPRIRKPSQVYQIASEAAPDEILFLLYRSSLKPVQERLRNYFQKYLPAVQEIAAEELARVEGKPGTPRYQKARAEFIARRLDHPPRKPAPPPPAPPPLPEPQPLRRGRIGGTAR